MDKITIERETLRSTLDVLTEMPPSPGKALVVSALRAALAAQPAHAAVPSDKLTWLFTHCRAIGMVEGSRSGKWEHDIALFTQRQAERIRVLREVVESAAAADEFCFDAGCRERLAAMARAALERTK